MHNAFEGLSVSYASAGCARADWQQKGTSLKDVRLTAASSRALNCCAQAVVEVEAEAEAEAFWTVTLITALLQLGGIDEQS